MNIFVKKYRWYIFPVAILCCWFLASCSSTKEPEIPELKAAFSSSPNYAWNSDGKFLVITTNDSWAITITYPAGEPTGWCSTTTQTGTGNKNVWIATTYNTSEDSRSALITVIGLSGQGTADEQSVLIPITQYGQGSGPNPPDTKNKMELPKIEDIEWYLEYNKGMFSIEYAPTKKHSKWVAWPLYKSLMGSSGRTDAWQWDPRIPSQYSPEQADFGKNGYDRGHLCPSADRTQSREMNAQTFMYSNMSPQIPAFNQGIWANLEDKERSWVGSADTLYICAGGTVLKESDIMKYTTPSYMAVPKYYFKVIVRKKASTGAYDGIGFWFENKSYSGTKLSVSQVKTIRDIETLTGIDFYYNLPQDIQDKVENEFNPSAWGL